MSGRGSLYRQSLVKSAGLAGDSQEKHWKRDWFVPQGDGSANGSSSSGPNTPVTPSAGVSAAGTPTPTPSATPFGDDAGSGAAKGLQEFNFRVKIWQPAASFSAAEDTEDGDLFDLEAFSTDRLAGAGASGGPGGAGGASADGNGLSESDIKSAVGSGGSIPGLSKEEPAAQPQAQAQAQPQDKETPVVDGDGDVVV